MKRENSVHRIVWKYRTILLWCIVVIISAPVSFLQYLQAFFQLKTDDRHIGRYAASCLHTMRQTKVSARKFPPSTIEIAVSLHVLITCILLP